jgi:hypothetical protein
MCFLQEQESNSFLKKKILSWQSEYQSKVAPIHLPKLSGSALTCLGQLVAAIVDLTRHENGAYCAVISGWVNLTTGDEVLGTKTIVRLCHVIGIEGRSTIDSMLSFLLANKLKAFFNGVGKVRFGNFQTFMRKLLELWLNPPQTLEIYGPLSERLKPEVHHWTTLICKVGQVQLLSHELCIVKDLVARS